MLKNESIFASVLLISSSVMGFKIIHPKISLLKECTKNEIIRKFIKFIYGGKQIIQTKLFTPLI